MLLGREIGLYPSNIVLDGDPALPPQKGGQSPNFRPMSIVPNGWMDQDSTWRGGGPWSRPHCTRWGPSYPPQKGGRVPQFSAHLYCGQTAGCIKMPLGMKVGLRPGDFVLDGTQPPPQKGAEPPIFVHVYCDERAGWIKPLGMKLGLGPGHTVLNRGPTSPPHKKGAHPNFRSMSVVAKRQNGSRWHLVRR